MYITLYSRRKLLKGLRLQINPVWSFEIMVGRMGSRRNAIILDKILKSTFRSEIGLYDSNE